VRAYSSALSTYGDETSSTSRCAWRPARPTCWCDPPCGRRGAESLTLDYDMESTAARWKVYDVKVASTG
jgi:ABC-type transporter MlaC component